MSRCVACLGTDTNNTLRPSDYEHGVCAEKALVRCASCGLYRMEQMPDAVQLGTYYPRDYNSFEQSKSRLLRFIFDRYYLHIARELGRICTHSSKILDVGCGSGDSLRPLRALGFNQISGIESDAEAVRIAQGHGFDVRQGSFEEMEIPKNTYDVIRMNHVIEHFVDPQKALEKAYAALKEGGFLIGETPNTQCLDFRLFGKYWGGVHFPRHLWLFSKQNFKTLSERIGFSAVRFRNCYRTVGWSGAIQNLLVDFLRLQPPKAGRFRSYPIFIIVFLPVTIIQSLFSSTGVFEFTLRKAS